MPSLAKQTSHFGSPKVHLSADLLDFCSRQGISEHLPLAFDLIERHFPTTREVCLQSEQDPETGEEWLELDVTLRGDEEQILEAYDRYTAQWVATVPWPGRHKIRLSYNVV